MYSINMLDIGRPKPSPRCFSVQSNSRNRAYYFKNCSIPRYFVSCPRIDSLFLVSCHVADYACGTKSQKSIGKLGFTNDVQECKNSSQGKQSFLVGGNKLGSVELSRSLPLKLVREQTVWLIHADDECGWFTKQRGTQAEA